MNRRKHVLTMVAFLVGHCFVAQAKDMENAESKPFAAAKIHFEQNVTDGDVEVVLEVKGGAEGLAKLTVVSPDGRTIVDFTAPDGSFMWMRQFRFESPEPRNVKSLKLAYPEGPYVFSGATESGVRLLGKASLNHVLPATVSLLRPTEQTGKVPASDLQITWSPVTDATAYMVYIEQDEMEVSLSATLPSTAKSFGVPNGFLIPETEYLLGIGAMAKSGNISFVETTFTTTGKAE